MPASLRNTALGWIATWISIGYAWWLGEMRGMVPARLKRLRAGRRRRVLLDISPQMIVVRDVRGQAVKDVARLNVEASEDEYSDVAGRISARTTRTVIVRLPTQSVLRRRITLPAALEPTLSGALRFEVERQTPYKAADIYFDHRIVGRRPDTRDMDVELSVIDRHAVDQALTLAGRLGLQPSAVGIDDSLEWPPSVNFMPDGPVGRKVWMIPEYGLAALALILFAATVMVMLNREARKIDQLTASVSEVRRQAVMAAELRDEIEQTVSQGQYLDRKKSRRSMMAVLRGLTVLLPDHAWIVEFDTNGTDARISGYARDASMLIGVLDGSNLFRNVSFTSPVVHDRTGVQRFNIAFEIATDGSS